MASIAIQSKYISMSKNSNCLKVKAQRYYNANVQEISGKNPMWPTIIPFQKKIAKHNVKPLLKP